MDEEKKDFIPLPSLAGLSVWLLLLISAAVFV